ncbi:unnamed protein product [Phytomonas sp. Hart1]|nr:unnamed protein product [Phytomonas sp. Hart1]|eukprot:CCW69481.1 unnamed protein product [Phytomonas sp. isolate Hart1]
MSAFFTFGAYGTNPFAPRYAKMATQSSKCGSKNFVYTKVHDDPMPGPRHHHRQSDVPWRDSFSWNRMRWIIHDFRMFGLFGALKKHYYIGESWRRKDEKIFVGKDEFGNKYWMSWRTSGSMGTRLVEPADPHWFRGQSPFTANGIWRKWLQGSVAHTPAQIKARGEWGLNSRAGIPMPFNIKNDSWSPINWGIFWSRDPAWVPGVGNLVNPERRVLQEAGFTRWVHNQGQPIYMPFCGVHDVSDELVEEYYRGHWAFGRSSKGNDHDDWQN